jgi:HD superfamily phosphodiesterase
MNQRKIIEKTASFAKDTLKDAEGGHDWFHIERVWKLAKRIGKEMAKRRHAFLETFLEEFYAEWDATT